MERCIHSKTLWISNVFIGAKISDFNYTCAAEPCWLDAVFFASHPQITFISLSQTIVTKTHKTQPEHFLFHICMNSQPLFSLFIYSFPFKGDGISQKC